MILPVTFLFTSVIISEAVKVKWLLPEVHDDISDAMFGSVFPTDMKNIIPVHTDTTSVKSRVAQQTPSSVKESSNTDTIGVVKSGLGQKIFDLKRDEKTNLGAHFDKQQQNSKSNLQHNLAIIDTTFTNLGNTRVQSVPNIMQNKFQSSNTNVQNGTSLTPENLREILLSTDTLLDYPIHRNIHSDVRFRSAALKQDKSETKVSGRRCIQSNPTKQVLQNGSKLKYFTYLRCRTCVYVLERIKSGFHNQLQAICVEVHRHSAKSPCGLEDERMCYDTLESLNHWGRHVHDWIVNGCYKLEVYGEVEKITPCPSHVICAQLEDLEQISFCKDPLPELSRDVGIKTTYKENKQWRENTKLPTSKPLG